MITGAQIVQIMPYSVKRVGSFIAPLNSKTFLLQR